MAIDGGVSDCGIGGMMDSMRTTLLLPFLFVATTNAQELKQLTTVAELRGLTPASADRQLPVKLRGVVTYAERDNNMFYVQDDTGGTYVGGPVEIVDTEVVDRFLLTGDLVEVEGVTNRGKFIPHVDGGDDRVDVHIVGQADLPAPLRPRRGEVFNPKLHNQWVEVEAFAKSVRSTKRWHRISLVVNGQSMNALILRTDADSESPDLINSDLRIRGVYGVVFNEQREMVGANLLVPSLQQIRVVDPGLAGSFAQPVVPIQDLRQFWPGPLERVHVKGIVTWSDDGAGFYLTDGDSATWIQPADGTSPKIGSSIAVVGYPSLDGERLRLRDAVTRSVPAIQHISVVPRPIAGEEENALRLHGQLVQLEGKIVDRLILPNTRVLALSNGMATFEARFPNKMDVKLPPRIAWVKVTGVYERLASPQNDAQFRILMRSPRDLQLLRSPPWWTVERIAWLLVGLMVVLVASFAWGYTLRRRVAAQSRVIATQIETQRIAEERTRIGRELHDTLEQHLTGVSMQIETASAVLPDSASQAREALETASAMLSHSRQEARRSVWELKTSVLETEGLDGALRELTKSMGSTTEITLNIPDNWNRLSGQAELHLLRIAQEAVANTFKHADATHIAIALSDNDSEVELSVRDNGCGFAPSEQLQGGRMHFGVVGMRERAGKLNASFQIDSKPDEGTSVVVRLRRESHTS